MSNSVRRNICLSKELDEKIKAKAKEIGLTVPEYIRHVLVNAVSPHKLTLSKDGKDYEYGRDGWQPKGKQ